MIGIKKIYGALFVLVFLQCVFSRSAAAQLPPSCMFTQVVFLGDPVPAGWFYYSSYPGTYQYVIAALICPPTPPCHCNTASNPIALATGETFIDEADIKIPGLGGGLSLTRTWNSTWPVSLSSLQTGIFGPHWRSTYEQRIVMSTDNYLTLLREDTTYWSFGVAGGSGSTTSWVVNGPANVGATFSTDTSTNSYFTLTLANGEQRRFDKTTGNLIAIIDRNGNTTSVAYDSSGRLSTVTDPAARTMTFNYGGSFPNLVTSVSTSVGISLSYSYDTQGRLTQVTKPDSTTISFTYDSLSRITAVTDSNGKILESHTYDSKNRGLTGSRANSVQAVTLTYQ